MAVTTVRISDKANRKLGELQAQMSLRTRRRVTKRKILEQLIDRAFEAESVILLAPPKYPLPPEVLRAFEGYGIDWGVQTREGDIDRVLYDEEQ